jgi:hypothetical protein
LEKKQAYDKPLLRKVRLEVKTSVLAACNTSAVSTPGVGVAPVTLTCKINNCYTSNQ